MKHRYGLGLSLLILLCVNGAHSAPPPEGDDPIYKYVQIYSKVLHLTLTRYVEPVDGKELIYGSLQGMLEHLDPYSMFLTPEDLAEMKRDTTGAFGGIGIEVTLESDKIRIITPTEGSPAHRAGILAGDLILQIDNKLVKDMTFTESVRSLRGSRGSKVKLLIERDHKPLKFELTREYITQTSVRSEVMDQKLLYLRIAQFQKGTTQAARKAIQNFLDTIKTPQGIVLDLRNNPGGLLEEAIAFSELFVKEGNIVYTVDREGNKKIEKAHSLNTFDLVPMVILINRGTASASEIVSGAFQDYRLAVLVGEKSFGKGSVQSVIELPDGSGIKLTVAKYYTPEGRSIHEAGIKPDLAVVVTPPPEKPASPPPDQILEEGKRVLAKIQESAAKSQKKLPDVVQMLIKQKQL